MENGEVGGSIPPILAFGIGLSVQGGTVTNACWNEYGFWVRYFILRFVGCVAPTVPVGLSSRLVENIYGGRTMVLI